MTDFDQLTPQLQGVLNCILDHQRLYGYAPSVRDIGAAVSIPSTSTVHACLRRLEDAGFLRRDPSKPRAMVVLTGFSNKPASDKPQEQRHTPVTADSERPFSDTGLQRLPWIDFLSIHDMFANKYVIAETESSSEQEKPVNEDWLVPEKILKGDLSFITNMPDDSMLNRMIYVGDSLIVKSQNTANNGDMIVTRLKQETMVRTYYKGLRQVRLQAENEHYETILAEEDELDIYGIVVGFIHLV